MAWANSHYCGKINRWSPRWKDQSLQKICKAKTCSFAARRSLGTLYMISSGVWIPQSFLKMPSSNILIIVELAVAELKDVEWDPTPFERLELKQEKMIIQALAESVQPGQDVMFDDFVSGKGQGVISLLAQHAPDIPAPKPLGLVSSNRTSYIFMSFVPGLTVNQIWPQLSRDQKASISDQLNDALLRLRALNVPDSVSLGGVDGEGCKDTRRHTRICQESVRTCAAFDFKFSNPHFGSSAYISLLRGLSSSHTAKVVFSHGDLRPENIVVQPDQHGNCFLTGILDWEKSGFYPDYFECTKATSNMSPSNADDWYLYLPRCASPSTYPLMWLVDRVWDIHIA